MRLDPILTQIDASIEAQLRMADPAVAKYLEGRSPRKVIVVPNRIVNVVV